MKVLLASMPFGALDRPALGLSMLKAEAARAGFHCDLRYLNIDFAELIGCEDYHWISSELPYTAFAGDWTFTAALYGARPRQDDDYIAEILRGTWRLHDDDIARLLRIRSLVPHFLDHCVESISWRDYDVVGFTSTFEQSLASLALAQRLKARHKTIRTVFGGANFEGEMGLALHQTFECIDYVCGGEADVTFPELLRRLRDGTPVGGASPLPGLVHRARGRSVFTGPPAPVRDLDAHPMPDFSDYFAALDRSSATTVVTPILLCETSRGCWWGAKSHCTFCGLNGSTMAFRRKSPQRALDEIEQLTERWRVHFIQFTDNILDMRYFDTVLAQLAERALPVRFFYEVKANLNRRQVRRLADAGVCRIQPGIESLSARVLKLMRKGTTPLRNIQLLKWCKEFGIEADWNVLYGFPGETRADYDEMLQLLRAIRFLGAPSGTGPLRLDRFSPYHNDPQAFGLRNVRPLAVYKYLYPVDAGRLARIAYHFDFDYAPQADPRDCHAEVVAFVEAWRREPEHGTLWAVAQDDGLLLVDTRSDAGAAQVRMSGPERIVYDYCEELRSLPAIAAHLAAALPGFAFREPDLLPFLRSLVANRLMVTDGTHYLSLAIPRPAVTRPQAVTPASARREAALV